jgi:hypothetical protein
MALVSHSFLLLVDNPDYRLRKMENELQYRNKEINNEREQTQQKINQHL